MPSPRSLARHIMPSRVRIRRSRGKTEIVIEGTIPVLVLGLLVATYVGHLLH